MVIIGNFEQKVFQSLAFARSWYVCSTNPNEKNVCTFVAVNTLLLQCGKYLFNFFLTYMLRLQEKKCAVRLRGTKWYTCKAVNKN